MKKRWIRLSNKILSGILVLLGFSGCGKDAPVEYGTPYSKLEIKGKVIDAQSETAIPGIEVVISHDYFPPDTLKSDSNGDFLYQGQGFSPNEKFSIICNDIDGQDNGGVYKSDTVNIKTGKAEEGNGWYTGKGEAEVTIKLEKE